MTTNNYSAAINSNSTIHFFQDFHADTMTAAKRWATKNLDYGYVGDVIELYRLWPDGQRQLVAQKVVAAGARWICEK